MKGGLDVEMTFEFSAEEAPFITPLFAPAMQIAQMAASTPLLLPTTIEQQARVQLGILANQAMLAGNSFQRFLPHSNGDGHGPRPTSTQSDSSPPDPEIPAKAKRASG